MKLEGYKLIFVIVGLIGVLLIAMPALGGIIRFPGGEQFSELYLLGPDRMTENYPYNITVHQNYSVYVGVANQLGSSSYYVLYVKLGNETDQMPNATINASSSLQPLYEYRFSVQDSINWESLLTFSVSNASISRNNSMINTLQINGLEFNVNKPALLDSSSTAFKYHLLIELWVYNPSTNAFLYNDRFVNLQLNLTTL